MRSLAQQTRAPGEEEVEVPGARPPKKLILVTYVT